MSLSRITVSVVGEGPLVDLVARHIGQRDDLEFVNVFTTHEALAQGSTTETTYARDLGCVVYLPSHEALVTGTAAEHIAGLLRAGMNVVSTVPAAMLSGVDLMAACREGGVTYHGTGGFQSRLVSRFNRAFASITRNIREIQLVEELDIGNVPLHPWVSAADAGLDNADAEGIRRAAEAIEGYYDAGLHTLADAVFGNGHDDARINVEAEKNSPRDALDRRHKSAQETGAQIVVRRSLGETVAYDSVWTKRDASNTPVKYRLNTTSTDAIGHLTLTFHVEGPDHPADVLACRGVIEAIRPVVESAPGVLHHDLDIHHVKMDDRLLV
jgi:hypothetical protein